MGSPVGKKVKDFQVLSGITCLKLLVYLSNKASFVLCVSRRVKDHRNSLQYSPLLRKPCVRQVVLDKCKEIQQKGLHIK